MDLLVLGGTRFLGRHVTDAALARGHRVTLFHRGKTNPGLYPQVEHLTGDRDGGLEALVAPAARRWDAVVDTSGYVPRVVRASAERLAPAVGHYTFVSSISVFPHPVPPGADETAPVATLADPTVEEVTGETYGALKAACERVVAEVLPGRALNVRPGLIVGPHDPTDRFTWWVRRVARGGEVLAPGGPDAPVQLVDARDLAEWIVAMAERGATGVYNATGPKRPLGLGAMLETLRAATGSDARFTWVDESFLLEHEVSPFSEMPLWVPAGDAGFLAVDAARARGAGLGFRPLADTARDTLAWDRATPAAERPPRSALVGTAGMDPARETGLLEAWRVRTPR